MTFPAPIGGVPFEEDFAPSIVFACVYAILVFVGFFRVARRTTRTLLILGPLAFSIERIVVWSLRAKQAKTPSQDLSRGLTIYWQITLVASYMTLWGTLVNLLRCLLVASTRGASPGQGDIPLVPKNDGVSRPAPYASENLGFNNRGIPPVERDKPTLRFWYRRVFDVLVLAAWAPFVTSTIMGNEYPDAETDTQKANNVQTLRYVTAAIALALIVQLQLVSTLALFVVRTADRGAVLLLIFIGSILLILPIYELAVIHNMTTSLTSTAPGSLNTHAEKAVFYVLMVAPETVAAAILLSLDIRNIFGTGLIGDPSTDKKEKPNVAENGSIATAPIPPSNV